MPKDNYSLFKEIVASAFYGSIYRFGDIDYKLQPRLIQKYDIIRVIGEPASEFERLVKVLPNRFKDTARTELYRTDRGWLSRGTRDHDLRLIKSNGTEYIIPWIGNRSVGIDTRSYEDKWTILSICVFNDPEAAYAYCEKHLELPKVYQPPEFKWARLYPIHRNRFLENLDFFLKLSCEAVLTIKTNALIKPEEKLNDIFIKLIDGCFSGYEKHKGAARNHLRTQFFDTINNTPIHCDNDFKPLTPSNIIRYLVKTLADGKEFTPLHAEKTSGESRPIQLADLICGAFHHHLTNKTYNQIGFYPLEFNNKLKGIKQGKEAKAYIWFNK